MRRLKLGVVNISYSARGTKYRYGKKALYYQHIFTTFKPGKNLSRFARVLHDWLTESEVGHRIDGSITINVHF
jgi:hypothetical protein